MLLKASVNVHNMLLLINGASNQQFYISLSLSLSQVQFPGCVCGVRDHHTGGERGRHPHRHFRPKITVLQLQGPGGELQRVHYFLHHSRLAGSEFSCMLVE